jgi:hypothetical protein
MPRRRRGGAVQPPPRLKVFRPMTWYDSDFISKSASEYVSHLLLELGRLGLKPHDVESHSRPPHTQTVLSDLLDWLSEHPTKAYRKLVDWQILNLQLLYGRLESDKLAKPRIELSAHITKMENLSVRWHPGGWRESGINWNPSDRNYFNLIPRREWKRPPDFHWFEGDEEASFTSRASNELMYIRGVGNLRPEPKTEYGYYATYNHDVVDSILICAVRAAYEALAEQLRGNFEVDVIDGFDFVTRDEDDESRHFKIHRVVSWSLEDAAKLRERKLRAKQVEKEKKDRLEIAELKASDGLNLERLNAALMIGASPKRSGAVPDNDRINQRAAKSLREAGLKIDSSGIRHLRQLLEQYEPESLPEALRPVPESAPLVGTDNNKGDSTNVVTFPTREN